MYKFNIFSLRHKRKVQIRYAKAKREEREKKLCNAAFTLNGFDDQERNRTFVKTDFQVLKPKLKACSFKQDFYPLHNLNIARSWQQENSFIQAFLSVPGCQTCMWKSGIS